MGDYSASELGFARQNGMANKLAPVAGGGFRSRPGIFEIHHSKQQLNSEFQGITSSTLRSLRSRSSKAVASRYLSALNVSASANFNGDINHLEDWSQFRRETSRPTSPSHDSTLDASSRYHGMGSSMTLNNLSMMTQSDYHGDFESQSVMNVPVNNRTMPLRRSLSTLEPYDNGSLIGIDADRIQHVESSIFNVLLNRVATESYGVILVDGLVS